MQIMNEISYLGAHVDVSNTLAFDDRFFFEVVQRCGGYQQYGAANAAVRMAAQTQWHSVSRLNGLLA